MSLLETRETRLGAVIQSEYGREYGHCRKIVTAYEASEKTYTIGTVLGKTLVSGTATATAASGNTGNGTMGSITVTGAARVGVYTLRITAAASNAGSFNLIGPDQDLVGSGTVAVAFSQAGLAFTLADGSTDFAVGDVFAIIVSGTEKYKILEATATDGSQYFAGIYMGDSAVASKQTIAATTDTSICVLYRGPASVGKDNLVWGSSVNTDAEKAGIYAAMDAVGIKALTQPNQMS